MIGLIGRWTGKYLGHIWYIKGYLVQLRLHYRFSTPIVFSHSLSDNIRLLLRDFNGNHTTCWQNHIDSGLAVHHILIWLNAQRLMIEVIVLLHCSLQDSTCGSSVLYAFQENIGRLVSRKIGDSHSRYAIFLRSRRRKQLLRSSIRKARSMHRT